MVRFITFFASIILLWGPAVGGAQEQFKPNQALNLYCVLPAAAPTSATIQIGKMEGTDLKILGTMESYISRIKRRIKKLKGQTDKESRSKRRTLKAKKSAAEDCLKPSASPPPATVCSRAPQIVRPTGNSSVDNAGKSVAHYGDWAIIGVPNEDDKGSNSGAASIFHFDGAAWQETQKLVAPDGVGEDHFGYSVALWSDLAVIGAFNHDARGANSGAAYVFRRSGTLWNFEAKLLALDGQSGDAFGFDVAVNDNLILVGAYGDDDKGTSSGAVYVFTRSNSIWSQQQKIVAHDGEAFDYFGVAVAASAERLVVGAYLEDEAVLNGGAVYVYKKNGANFQFEAKLLPQLPESDFNFGSDVSISDLSIAVGAPDSSEAGPSTGAVYPFRFNGSQWLSQGKLTPSNAQGYESFGQAISINGDLLAVGAPTAKDHSMRYPHIDQGSIYIFKYDGALNSWREQTNMLAFDGWSYEMFGTSVSIDSANLFVGAPGDANGGTDAGSAYNYDAACF